MSRLLRAGALVAVPVLVLGALPAQAAPAPQRGQAQADDAAAYLAGNLTDGVLSYQYFGGPYDDFGSTVDAAVVFDLVGGHSADLDAISGALSSRLTDYTDYSYDDGGVTVANRAAGATAKAIVGLQAAGKDPRNHPDGDLVARLEGMLTAGPAGQIGERVTDQTTRDGVLDPSADDYANSLSQSFAVTALRQAGSTHAAAAASFLAHQQCADTGYFVENLVASNQGCADPSAASVDATALAVSTFVPLYSDSTVGNEAAFVLTKAQQYLQSAQRSNGGFGSAPGGTPNANATGLAVAALRQLATVNPTFDHYATPIAVKGAAWLRAHQLDNVGSCTPYASYELGAVAYDDAARSAAEKDGITAATEVQFIKGTAQSAEGLLSAPTDPTVLKASGPTTYVADGSTSTVRVTGAAPGSAVCLSTGRVQKSTSVTGSAAFSVKAPAKTATTTFTFTGVDGAPATAVVKSLGAKTFGLTVRARVSRGGTQRAIVTGLAVGEKVSVRTGATVKSGVADAKGVFNVTFKASTIPGTKTVTVVGQFYDRKASTKFTVVK
jgi:hypothetical protein